MHTHTHTCGRIVAKQRKGCSGVEKRLLDIFNAVEALLCACVEALQHLHS
jgi:hypothetical protein